jgi:hypothetical protein
LKNKQRFDIILNMEKSNPLSDVLEIAIKAEKRVLKFLESHPKESAIAMIALASLPVFQLGPEVAMALGLPLSFLAISLYLPDLPKKP